MDIAIDKNGTENVGRNKNNERRIDFMIQSVNPNTKRKRGQVKDRGYVLEQYRGHFDTSSQFKLRFYQRCTFITDPEMAIKQRKIHKIKFLFGIDSDDIYALPSGSGRSALIK